MPEAVTVSRSFAVSPQRLYRAWLDPADHGQMIGATATAEPDGRFSAWDGYITGRTLKTVPNASIVQSWRTTDFAADAPDSRLEVVFEPEGHGTKLTLRHGNIPDGMGKEYEEGWHAHYFEPMQRFFSPPGQTLEDVGARVSQALDRATHSVAQAIEATQRKAKAALSAVASVKAKSKATQKRATKVAKSVVKTAKRDARTLGKKVRGAAGKKRGPAAKAPGAKAKRRPAKRTRR